MPGGDGTGPMGMGPMTGRAAGYCGGYSMPGYANFFSGRLGMGFGRGRGFARRQWAFQPGYYSPMPGNIYQAQNIPQEQELSMLQNQAKLLQDQLETINRRVSELETKKNK